MNHELSGTAIIKHGLGFGGYRGFAHAFNNSDKGPIHILINNAGGLQGAVNATVEELPQPFTRHLHAAHLEIAHTGHDSGKLRSITIVSTRCATFKPWRIECASWC